MASKSIDPAALAGTTVAGVLATLLQPGPFDVIDTLVGVTLLLILIGYDSAESRPLRESIAIGAVFGFVGVIALGWPIEYLAGRFFNVGFPTLGIVIVWMAIAVGWSLLQSRKARA